MIQQNLPRVVRRKLAKEQAQHGKQSVQHVCNSLLWKIVMNNGGKINIPCTELKQVPLSASLKVQYNTTTDSMVITATLSQSKIIAPNNGLIV